MNYKENNDIMNARLRDSSKIIYNILQQKQDIAQISEITGL